MTQHNEHVRDYLFGAWHTEHIKAWRRWMCVKNAAEYRDRHR